MKVSRTGAAPALHSIPFYSRSLLESPKMGSLYFWRPFQELLSRRHGGATGVLFRVPRSLLPLPATRRLNWDCRLSLFGLVVHSLIDHCPTSCTLSAGLPPLWQEKRPPQTSSTLAPKRMVTGGGRTGKKTVVETATSTRIRPRKIKIQRCVTM